jgi:hypothetical protein
MSWASVKKFLSKHFIEVKPWKTTDAQLDAEVPCDTTTKEIVTKRKHDRTFFGFKVTWRF